MASAAAATKPRRKAKAEAETERLPAIKGFGLDWTCRGYQYALGQTYSHDGDIGLCESGFHACHDHPLAVFGYYPPAASRYADVVLHGRLLRDGEKTVAAEITVGVEINLHDLIARAVKWVFDRVDWTETAATNTGVGSAATNTGDYSAATNTGDYSAATNTGHRSAATNTGHYSAATNTGDCGTARASGHHAVAMATGQRGRASGKAGCALFLAERDNDGEIIAAWAGIVGRDGIEPGAFYTLRDGKPVAAEG